MRRRFLGGFAAIVLVLAACQSGEGAPSTTTSPPATSTTTAPTTTTTGTTAPTTTTTTTVLPGPNEVVIGGDDQEPPTLNPYAPGGDNSVVSRVGQAIFAGLTEVDGGTGAIIPDLAEELPTVANGGVVIDDDGTTRVAFQIRDEAVWDDGTPITGDDVAFTYETLMAAAPGTLSLDRTPYEAITNVEAHGRSVTFTFAAPNLAFETMFPVILPRHQMEGTDLATDWNTEPWLSAGPFIFESWEPGEQLTLVRNERYWKTDPATGERLPHLDRVVFRFIPETERLIEAFEHREIDAFLAPPVATTVAWLRSQREAEVSVGDSTIWEHWSFQLGERNRNADSLNRHLEFRRAVAHALDRQALTDLGFWEADRFINGILNLHGLPSDRPWSQYEHDPQLARHLIGDLCGRLGRDCDAEPPVVVFSTTSNAEARPAIARLAVEMLAEAGIEVRLELEDSMLFFGPTVGTGTWDLGQWAWVALPGPAGVLQTLSLYDPDLPPPQTDAANYSRWGTPAVTSESSDFNQGPSLVRDEHTARYAEILDEMRATADHDRFAALAREAENILADQVVFIPLVARATVSAVWADEIAGYGYSTWLDTWDIETWRRADR